MFSDSNYAFEELQAEERWTRFLVRIQREREREREKFEIHRETKL